MRDRRKRERSVDNPRRLGHLIEHWTDEGDLTPTPTATTTRSAHTHRVRTRLQHSGHSRLNFTTPMSTRLGQTRQRRVGAVERFDFGGDGSVFVGDDPVGDLGVAAGQVQGSMSEQGSDDVDGHAPVDGSGGKGVTEALDEPRVPLERTTGPSISTVGRESAVRCLGHDAARNRADLVPSFSPGSLVVKTGRCRHTSRGRTRCPRHPS